MRHLTFTHDREEWEDPNLPVANNGKTPAFPGWEHIDMFIIHYTAANDLVDGDPGEDWNYIPQYFRNIQNAYVNGSRGYSIGYNMAVDQRGHSWELRGEDFRCAANNGDRNRVDSDGTQNGHSSQYNGKFPNRYGSSYHNCNWHAVSCLVLVDGNDTLNPVAVDEVNRLIAQARNGNPDIRVLGHQDIDYTACPGVGVYSQIQNGRFDGMVDPINPIDPGPTPGDEIYEELELRFASQRLFDGPVTGEHVVVLTGTNPNAKGLKLAVHMVGDHGNGYGAAAGLGDDLPEIADFVYGPGRHTAVIDVPANDGKVGLFFKSSSSRVIIDQRGVWLS